MRQETKTEFRIGGCYRQKDGRIVKIVRVPQRDESNAHALAIDRWDAKGLSPAVVHFVNERTGEVAKCTDGWRNLADGTYPDERHRSNYGSHLLPGELQFKDGQWVPVEEHGEGSFAGSTEWRQRLQTVIERGRPVTTQTTIKVGPNTAEPKRPALTWNTKTKFDPFPGFIVKSCTQEQGEGLGVCGFRSPDMTPADGQVPFGSAHLLKE